MKDGEKAQILRVALNTPRRTFFDYLPPENVDIIQCKKGLRVRVPFGRSTRIGMIADIQADSEIEASKLKKIEEILDQEPIFNDSMLKLIYWASDYYHYPLGEVFLYALPSWLRKGKPVSKISLEDSVISSENSAADSSNSSNFSNIHSQKTSELFVLNSEQKLAIERIQQSFGQFKPFLLDGVTGSGKTEVYIQIIEQALLQNKQALVLVPEIGLTPQMLERFKKRFSVPISVLHSSLSEKKRFEAFESARSGEAKIVIGTRSAVFTPLLNPGIFILDEEHDNSFKQQDSFRYNARDLLVMRGSLEQCPVVLGTATPSLETLYNAQQNRYQRLRLSTRAGTAKPPEMQVLDIRHRKCEDGLSSQLVSEIQKHLNEEGQILLFLNRRGYAPVLMCYDCGHVSNCVNCDAHLTLHAGIKKLRCHHCDLTLPIPPHCPACQSLNMHPVGVGTERLETALERIFPEVPITRIDRDTTRRKGTLQQVLDKAKSGEARILLGTQMLAKGHHFPNVTLSAIIDIDSALFSTDFRSLENLGQLLTQVSGRAGRENRPGYCLLQTCHPEHPLLKILLEKGYHYFAEHLLAERRTADLPPFSYQALIRTQASKNELGFHFLQHLKEYMIEETGGGDHRNEKALGLQVLGPIKATMERKAASFHAQLLIQSKERSLIKRALKNVIYKAEQHPLSKKLRWSIDVDPIEMI